jgi:hypothetical protein
VRGQPGNWLSYRDKLSKKSLFKNDFEKWSRNIEKHLVFVLWQHFGVFESVVGELYKRFSH